MTIAERIVDIVYEEMGKATLEAVAHGGLRSDCQARIAAELDHWLTAALARHKAGVRDREALGLVSAERLAEEALGG